MTPDRFGYLLLFLRVVESSLLTLQVKAHLD